jgi:hypothetical protein
MKFDKLLAKNGKLILVDKISRTAISIEWTSIIEDTQSSSVLKYYWYSQECSKSKINNNLVISLTPTEKVEISIDELFKREKEYWIYTSINDIPQERMLNYASNIK